MGMLSATVISNYKVVGLISVIFTVAYYGAPLSTMIKVIRYRNSASLHILMIMVNLINAILWTSYGAFAVNDLNIWLPNALGIALSSGQIILVILFPKRSTMDDNNLQMQDMP